MLDYHLLLVRDRVDITEFLRVQDLRRVLADGAPLLEGFPVHQRGRPQHDVLLLQLLLNDCGRVQVGAAHGDEVAQAGRPDSGPGLLHADRLGASDGLDAWAGLVDWLGEVPAGDGLVELVLLELDALADALVDLGRLRHSRRVVEVVGTRFVFLSLQCFHKSGYFKNCLILRSFI